MDIGKWCRICSIEVKYGVFLFSEEAKRSFLHAKIRKYLSVSISLEDKLPKMICEDCILKIDGFHKFATMALKNQDKMTRCILSTPVSPEPTKTENVSLLHTYLTKGTVDKTLQNNETEVMEMEVRVDPMSILQCCLEESESDNEIDVNSKINGNEYGKYDKEEQDQNEEETDEEGLSDQETGTLDNADTASSESENSENTCIIYLCSICKKSFATNFDLQDHMYVHSATYTKRLLSLNFNKFQESLAMSMVSSNNNQTTEEAQNEDAMQDTENDKTETSSKEEGHFIYKCPICARNIPTKGSLKVHLETHRPKGQYACDICGRVFKTQCNLFRHKEYHEGVQFPCETCGRVYPTNSTLRAHAITHSDLRPHKCPLCDKTFKRNQDLKFHINQHTGARPYQCPYCPKAFASSGNCFSHRKRMHPIEVERDRERAAKIMR